MFIYFHCHGYLVDWYLEHLIKEFYLLWVMDNIYYVVYLLSKITL